MVSSRTMASSSSKSAEDYEPSTSTMELDWEETGRKMNELSIFDKGYNSEENPNHRVLNVFNPRDLSSFSAMIHIDVPDTKQLANRTAGQPNFTAYNIVINGWHHGSVRYSHLYELAELVSKKFGIKYKGPDFPPRRLFRLGTTDIEERRQKIAKYFEALIQHPDITRHQLIEKKFLEFQVESFRPTSSVANLDIFLGNGEKIQIKCNISDSTNDILQYIGETLKCHKPDHFQWYFGLFLARGRDYQSSNYSITTDNFNPLIVRFLKNFEAPYISLTTTNHKSSADGHHHFLCLRKLVWSPSVEASLLFNAAMTDLFYRQAVHEYKLGFMDPVKHRHTLEDALISGDAGQEWFLRNCHKEPHYGYERLSDCISDYPVDGTACRIKIGQRQLVLSYTDDTGAPVDKSFRVTRIRIWRLTKVADRIMFQFQFLMDQDTFKWITLDTDQAILISLILQSIGSEVLSEHSNMTLEDQIMKEKTKKGIIEKKGGLLRGRMSLSCAVDGPMDPLGVKDAIPPSQPAYLNGSTDDDITNDDL